MSSPCLDCNLWTLSLKTQFLTIIECLLLATEVTRPTLLPSETRSLTSKGLPPSFPDRELLSCRSLRRPRPTVLLVRPINTLLRLRPWVRHRVTSVLDVVLLILTATRKSGNFKIRQPRRTTDKQPLVKRPPATLPLISTMIPPLKIMGARPVKRSRISGDDTPSCRMIAL